MDAVTIGASNSVLTDDSVLVEVKVAGEIPPKIEVNWLLILAALLAGAGATYAGTA